MSFDRNTLLPPGVVVGQAWGTGPTEKLVGDFAVNGKLPPGQWRIGVS
ncbi:hypothetical protein AWB81_07319 [Caballeronia arationis]|jgi:hypothetical protein|nr:hypothetical protein [Caballeronia arationis]SAL05815.1 hypothetical protein AWB81_07319 [Caballeronia arationis]